MRRHEDFDAIESALRTAHRRIAIGLNDTVDILDLHRARHGVVSRIADGGGRYGRDPVAILAAGAATHVRDLAHELRAMAMDAL